MCFQNLYYMLRLIDTLHEGGYSCVVRKGGVTRTFARRGVADLRLLLRSEPGLLDGADVADKVVGRAAAALLIAGGVRRVHADVISSGALAMLRDAGTEVSCGTEVPCIENRARTGCCPLEERCSGAATAEECLPIIEDFIGNNR